MASKSLGTLTLDLVARIGGYTAGLDKAEKEAQKRAKAIEKAFDTAAVGVGIAFGAIATAGAAAFAAISQGVEEAAKFQDLAEMTGGSAEGFASLAVAAKTAGVDIESIAAASIKLTKNLTGVDDESKAAGAALAALGIPLQEFKKLAPEQQIDALTKAFAGFADGTGKTAVALDLWGKSGAEQLKLMKALEEQGGRTVILTAEQIRQADDYADKQAKLKAEITQYAAALSTLALPALNAFGNAIRDIIKDLVGTNSAQNDLGRNLVILDWAEKSALALATVGETAVALAKTLRAVGGSFESVYADSKVLNLLTPTGAVQAALNGDSLSSLLADRNAKAKEANQRYVDLWTYDGASASKAIKKSFDEQRKVLKNNADPELQRLMARSRAGQAQLPDLSYTGKEKRSSSGGSKDDPTKQLLDNDLKAFKAQADQAKELLSDRNKILDLYNAQGLISVKDYYAALQGNAEEATAAQRKSLDDQIKALQAFQAKTPKASDKADAQGKINDLLIQQSKLERDAGTASLERSVKQQQANQAYVDSLNEVNAQILELDGNLGKAAEIRFDAQNRQLRELAKASGDFASVAQIDRLREYKKAQADINALQSKFSLAQGDLSIAEERITQARERGTMGEIEALRASGDARKAAIAVMQEQLEKFQALDAAMRTPEQNQAIERLKVQLEGLKSTVDPLADKFNTLFSDAAGNAFASFIDGSKSAKEAFKDFTNSILSEISSMVAKNLAKQLFGSVFGGGASGGGIGGILSTLFGGSSGGGGSDPLGALINLNGWERGGFTGVGAANEPAGIVHKGEYVLDAKQTREIGVANLDRGNFGGGMVVNFAVEGTIDRTTQTQAANRLRQAQFSAGSRFG